ncbi:hypothetical protein Dda_4566 [Drechslerella dactyloides]|uniref:DUF1279 domain-containing protein n=1 Tax=Drechslerella dactyloides TaxID=74499 RepID=A0AAD6IZD9_DREDA|nr:hypothetical protein Dda_4566 [Drechslerella dactyloides]
MAARPMAAALKRASLSPSFFTSPLARRTNLLHPRYFTPKTIQSAQKPLQRSLSPFSSVLNAFRTSKPARLPTRRAYSTNASPSTTNGTNNLTVGQRMRQLFKEYGFSAVGVYFLLSVLDFPFCFLFVKAVGAEKIAYYEHIIIDKFWSLMPEFIRQFRPKVIKEERAEAEAVAQGIGGDIDALAHGEGMKEDVKASGKSSASLGTILLLAYAVHKSLIFLRVPLTAAVTPKIVQRLRGWGFNIGQKGGVRKSVKDARATLKERRARSKKDLDDD